MVLTLKQLDLFQRDDKKKIDKLLAELKSNYPEIDWQTEGYQYENIPGNFKVIFRWLSHLLNLKKRNKVRLNKYPKTLDIKEK